jgi:U3 small nucleolar RNA-associated protein 25
MDDGNSVTTKLLTLLNVSATKIGKRKRVDEFVHSETKLNKRLRPLVSFEQFTEEENLKAINTAKEGHDVEEAETGELDETEGMNHSSLSFKKN